MNRIVIDHIDPAMLATANERKHWTRRAKVAKHWREIGFTLARKHRLPKLNRARIVVAFRFPDNRRRDVHNLAPVAKALIDGVVSAGVLPDDDDGHLIGPDLRRERPNGKHRITITIEELAPNEPTA